MNQSFIIRKWSVWPPITESEADVVTQKELLSFIPRMLKRRLTPLAKVVFSAVELCVGGNSRSPTVFSSTHGELAKSFKMMQMIEEGDEISPTSFSLSVHNSIAGLFSMAYENKAQTTVAAPGEEGIAAAFVEAVGLLREGAGEVLVVLYDEPLVEFYPSEPYKLTTSERCAVALCISNRGTGIPLRFSCQKEIGDDGEQPLHVPLLVKFLSETQEKLIIRTPRHSWCWEKNY